MCRHAVPLPNGDKEWVRRRDKKVDKIMMIKRASDDGTGD